MLLSRKVSLVLCGLRRFLLFFPAVGYALFHSSDQPRDLPCFLCALCFLFHVLHVASSSRELLPPSTRICLARLQLTGFGAAQ